MRFPVAGGRLHYFGIIEQLLDDVELALDAEGAKIDIQIDFTRLDARSAVDASQAGQRVLNLVDGVLLRALEGQIQIEDHLLLWSALQKEVARDVRANLLDQVPQRDEIAGALAELHLFSAALDPNQLHEDHLEEVGSVTQTLEDGLHTLHVTVVIGTPDIDGRVEPAGGLIAMVCDVRQEIGVGPVALHQNAIFIVAETAGGDPDRTLAPIEKLLGFQRLEHRVDRARIVEAAFGRERVELDAERAQILFLFGHQTIESMVPHELALFRAPHRTYAFAELTLDLSSQLGHVLAVVAALRYRLIFAPELQVSRCDRVDQLLDLSARIIHVELAVHIVARTRQQARDRVPDRGPTTVPDVEGAGRVGRDELDVDPAARARGRASVLVVLLRDLPQAFAQELRADREVDESGSRDLSLLQA